MARYQQQRDTYPIGSVSSATMRPEDLIPTFTAELEYQLKHGPRVSRETRKAHTALAREINARMESEDYYDSESADFDLESLSDALDAYAGPYFYFGAHPGDGCDYGFWLSEDWDQDFVDAMHNGKEALRKPWAEEDYPGGIRVSDLADVPKWFRGEVAVVNDHGNCALYVKTARTLRVIWEVV
jgi:hypothetical protein